MNNIATTLPPELQLKVTREFERSQLRRAITTQVADTDSLLGTTSDTTHLLLNELSGFINKLNKANTLAEVRASATSLQSAIGHIEADVAAGSLTFPYQSKGQQSVMDEISSRATAVNQVLSK